MVSDKCRCKINVNYSSFAPLISVTVKTVRVKNNIFKAKSFAYILQPAPSGSYDMIRRKQDITYWIE